MVDLPDTIEELRERMKAQETVYNTIRPHQALGLDRERSWLGWPGPPIDREPCVGTPD